MYREDMALRHQAKGGIRQLSARVQASYLVVGILLVHVNVFIFGIVLRHVVIAYATVNLRRRHVSDA